jgi:hypothetical protein
MLWVWAITMTLLFVGSLWCAVAVTKQNLMLNDQREELVDQIQESLDMLDVCYTRLVHHSQIPVLSDEPIIQDIVNDIKAARNTVLAVASKIAVYGDDEKETEER